MKSYKDLDREIILNTPEGAMWVAHAKDEDDTNMYYKVKNGRLLVNCYASWGTSSNNSIAQAVLRESGFEFIPLPNIEIPWEVTEDSVCPVPDGCEIKIKTDSGWVPGDYTTGEEDVHGIVWSRCGNPILAYKIIDEDYLKPAQEEPIHVPELEMHRAAYQAIKNAGFESPEELLAQHKCLLDKVANTSEDKLTKRLKFLQNLANEFPEIRNEAIKFMECELDGYMNTLWEKDNDE